MRIQRRVALLSAAGVGLYALAAAAPLGLYSYFWTDHVSQGDVPWRQIGQSFVSGACASIALVAVVCLGLANRRAGRRAVWSSLAPGLLFLSMPAGQGVNVLLHTKRIWAGLPAAASEWSTFEAYLRSNTVSGLVALGAAFIALLFVQGGARGEAA